MKKLLTIFVLLISVLTIYPQKSNKEFRSVWVVTWDIFSAGNTVDQAKARIRTVLDSVKAANMNAVLWHVRQAGTAYYRSSYEPWGSYVGNQDPGFDPLEYAIQEAHARGMELHAWFNVFAAGSTKPGAPAQKHPNWICRDMDGNPMTADIALSPGHDSVRTYTLNVAMEVVRNYDIDGFHMDYVRWNEFSAATPDVPYPKTDGEDQESSEKPAATTAGRFLYDELHPYSAGIPSGFSSWPEYWRHSVNEFVRRLHDSINSIKPHVKLSAAAIGKYNWSGWNGYNEVFQDAAKWFNEGWLQHLTPMSYHWTDGPGFVDMLVNGSPNAWGDYIKPGIAAGRLFSAGPGSYILEDNKVWNNHGQIVEALRTVPWNDGVQFFSYSTWRNHSYFTEAGNTFFKKKTKIRSWNVIANNNPAPVVAINKINSLSYKINISPAGLVNPQWFIIYRSKTTEFIKDSSEIVAIRFSKDPFIVDEVFTGTQDYNGVYNYKVTMADRYWNETDFSNMISTDPILSVAPSVVSAVPAQNSTAGIRPVVKIQFNKNLNVSTVSSAFSINPSVPYTLTVSELKNVNVSFDADLAFNTEYTITLGAGLKDVNDVAIDGNGDGTPGDAYQLKFKTIGVDSIAPVLVYSNPNAVDGLTEIDPEIAVTLVFDEYLDSASVSNDNFKLMKGSVEITKEIVHHRLQGKTILNIKGYNPLSANTPHSVIIKTGIKDVWGNSPKADQQIDFTTSSYVYTKIKIDEFTDQVGWAAPTYSGSTVGVVPIQTTRAWITSIFVPTLAVRRSMQLQYTWDSSATTRLIRQYLSEGPARAVTFDTSYVLQVYLYGDGSGNKFRFAIDEGDGTNWPGHEVSKWITIDWLGWKIVEWDLSDPSTVGTWIGNDTLNGTLYRMDSFQFTDALGSALTGKLYFDNLKAIKRTFTTDVKNEEVNVIPGEFSLMQNYPNPFNPSTIIPFNINKSGIVTLEVFDVLGRKVKSLINTEMNPGSYKVEFNGSELASGKYIYRLMLNGQQISKMMMLVK